MPLSDHVLTCDVCHRIAVEATKYLSDSGMNLTIEEFITETREQHETRKAALAALPPLYYPADQAAHFVEQCCGYDGTWSGVRIKSAGSC